MKNKYKVEKDSSKIKLSLGLFNSLRRKKSSPITTTSAMPIINTGNPENSVNTIQDSMKARPRLLTPSEEISALILLYPNFKTTLSEIYFHEKYPIIRGLFEIYDKSTESGVKINLQTTIKITIESFLKIIGEDQDLLDSVVKSVLVLSKHDIWDDFLIKDKEADYETLKVESDYEIMQSQIEEEQEKEPDYMDMNGTRKSLF